MSSKKIAAADQIGEKLDKLAIHVLDELLSAGNAASLQQRIEGLKAIGALHLGRRKIDAKLLDEGGEEGVISMTDLRRRVSGGGG